MITPELMEYIKGELVKGRTREDVRLSLAKDGGWSEIDLSEAFRTVSPAQNIAQNSGPSKISPKLMKIILAVVILAGIGFAVWFYRAPLIKFWNAGIDKISSYFVSDESVETVDTLAQDVQVIMPVVPVSNVVKDCGATDSPDLKNKSTYENNAVLNCLGNSAILCQPAKATLSNSLFPNTFQIIRDQNTGACNFVLSYSADSTLVDITGQKLALQYISCPVSIVKSVNETKIPPIFGSPSIDNLGKYASQIYF